MTDEELEAARIVLQARRQQILDRSNTRRIQIGEELDSREIETNENAAEIQDAIHATELTSMDVDLVAGIEAALLRIELGSYGLCTVCGRPIEPARLAAMPEAATCLDDADLGAGVTYMS
jgi:DnaK suppressor protein